MGHIHPLTEGTQLRARRILTGGVIAAGILAMSSCSSNTPTGPTVASLQVTPDTARLTPGANLGLVAAPLDAGGHVVANATVTFASADTAIVTVNVVGLVHARRPGSTTISVQSGGVGTTVSVFVVAVPASVVVTPGDTTIRLGQSYDLTAVVLDSAHTAIPGAAVTFSSADTSIARVSPTGHVTSVGGGTIAISATSGPVFGQATVTVTDTSLVAHTTLSGGPFGAAATRSGVVYVLRYIVNAASRFDLPDTSVGATVALDAVPTGVAFDSGGAVAYVTAQLGGMVQVITVSTNTVTDSIPVVGNPAVVRVSPDDHSIWVSTTLDSLYQIDRSTKAVLAAYGMPGIPNGLAFNPANDSMLYASTSGPAVIEVNYKRKTIGRTFTPGGTTQGIAISPDGSALYVANETNDEIETYNLVSGTAGNVAATAGGAFDLQLSADGTKIWVTLSSAGKVQEFDRSTLTLLRTIRTGGTPRRLAISGANPVVVPNEGGWVDFIKP